LSGTGAVIVMACLISLITYGPRSSFGLFNGPLTEARGWDREVFALAIAAQHLLWGLIQPFAGAIADRLGSARVLAYGAIIYALGIALMSVCATPLAFQLTAGLLVGLGLAGASLPLVIAAVARRVSDERRSWAFGIVTAAGSFGQFTFAPLGQGLISAYGWQYALWIFAGCVATVPLLAFVLGRAAGPAAAPARVGLELSGAIRVAFAHRSYLLLISGFFVCGFHVAFITTHLPPYLTDSGASASMAASAIAIIGLCNILGAYGAGVLGGRFSKRYLLSGLYLLRAIAITLFLSLPKTPGVIIAFAIAMGLLWLSTVPLTSGLVAVMFGTRYLGTLYGFVFLSHQAGAFTGVWLGGTLFDATGSYDAVWILAVVLGLLAAAVHWPIDERRAPAFAESAA
jgi:predicted MFS family arabinose efflux permease